MSDYNGWSNRATWNVNLWVENEYAFYLAKREREHNLNPGDEGFPLWTALKVEAFVESLMPGKTPDGITYGDVDWEEIAQSWNSP